jgi:pantetheine-phosphate adenylyltransferase
MWRQNKSKRLDLFCGLLLILLRKELIILRIGLYPGTFDPITFGHLDIIGRAATLVDRLVIGVAINTDKSPFFSVEERVTMIDEQINLMSKNLKADIVTHPFENLLIDCARDVGASLIFRGLRAVSDFEYEFQMVGMNRALNDSIETVFLMADVNHQAIASKLVKEIARLGGDVRNFVPSDVNEAIFAKFEKSVK